MGQIDKHLGIRSISCLERWLNDLPLQDLSPHLPSILPVLAGYLQQEKQKIKKNTTNVMNIMNIVNTSEYNNNSVTERVLNLLGGIGGMAHGIVGEREYKRDIVWDNIRKLEFTMPLMNKRLIIFLDDILPKVIQLTGGTTHKQTRMAAIELFHAFSLLSIGEANRLHKSSFHKIYSHLIPEILRLATDLEQIPRTLFHPLVFQIVRWFSSSKNHEGGEVHVLLDLIFTGSCDKSNQTMRELCIDAIIEFIKYNLKHLTTKQIKENPKILTSVIRRVESMAGHPDPFKKQSALALFERLLTVIREERALVEIYLMEIIFYVVKTLKGCHYTLLNLDTRDKANEVIYIYIYIRL